MHQIDRIRFATAASSGSPDDPVRPENFLADPVRDLDRDAQADIAGYIQANGNAVLHQGAQPEGGTFVAPTLIRVGGIGDLEREVFGPILHIYRYAPSDLKSVAGKLAGIHIAGAYSIADMASVGWIRHAERQGESFAEFPHLKRWLDEVRARSAVELNSRTVCRCASCSASMRS